MNKTLNNKILLKYYNKNYTYEDVCETFTEAIKAYIAFNKEIDTAAGCKKPWIRYIPLSFKQIAEDINYVDSPCIGKELLREIFPCYEPEELYKFLNEYGVITRKEYIALKQRVKDIINKTNHIIKDFVETNPNKKLDSKSKTYFKLYYYIDTYDHCFSIEEFQEIYNKGGINYEDAVFYSKRRSNKKIK